jgi:hypothetical protein
MAIQEFLTTHFALLVDGGNYNGQAHYRVWGLQRQLTFFGGTGNAYHFNTTDFATQADILEASLTELIGIDLLKLTTGAAQSGGLSGIKITAS